MAHTVKNELGTLNKPASKPPSKYDIGMQRLVDDRDCRGLIRRFCIRQIKTPPCGSGRSTNYRHGYEIGPGTIYILLHHLAREGYLRSKRDRSGSRYRSIYRITPAWRRALNSARSEGARIIRRAVCRYDRNGEPRTASRRTPGGTS